MDSMGNAEKAMSNNVTRRVFSTCSKICQKTLGISMRSTRSSSIIFAKALKFIAILKRVAIYSDLAAYDRQTLLSTLSIVKSIKHHILKAC